MAANPDMVRDVVSQVRNAAPPITVSVMTTIGGFTLNEWVAVATLVYIAAQTGYLLWRWWRDWLKARAS